ncbi:MAG: 50S ribosomal protein L29 [Verrucomicrobia bacterium]|jgi:ribosomal protein L29|nr:50S ribosomal protein L29 [Verrucomicrobiota bacterium]
MEWEKLKELEPQQLEDQIRSWQKERFQLRVEASRQKKMEKPHHFQAIRKQIARAYTLIRQKKA